MLGHRLGHYLLLLAATAALTLPNLGTPSLWDIDEGLNAEAAREMLESGNFIKPTFNFELRAAKPALLYWLQVASYRVFSVSEFAARMPSVLCAMLTVILTYELGRRMFSPTTGLLAGLVLASAVEFCTLAHAATPDSLLLACTMLTFFLFWRGAEGGGRGWFVPTGFAAGLAVLAKGPVGVALPGLVIGTYFLWSRQFRRLWDRRLVWGGLVFACVALPWYVLVAVETRAEFLREFLGNQNLHRFLSPMENHRGPVFYHLAGLFVFFAPWCIFLGATLWYAFRAVQSPRAAARGLEREASPPPAENREPYRFLLAWFLCYLIFFSLAATKLPNYVLPLYPALAVLTARFLDRWRLALLAPPGWLFALAFAGLAVVGAVTALGLLVVGGAVHLPFGKIHTLPGLERWAALGIVPLAGAAAGIWFYCRRNRSATIAALTGTSVLYVGLVAALPVATLDAHKAPRPLVKLAGACQPDREVRLAALGYFQPSLVFYGQRQVHKLNDFRQALDFLALPQPVYLFVPEPLWEKVGPLVPTPHRTLARHYDFYCNYDVVVVTNQ